MHAGVAHELEIRLPEGRKPLQGSALDLVRLWIEPVLHRVLVVDDEAPAGLEVEQERGQAQDHQVDDAPFEGPIRDALGPALALRHHARQLRVRRERDGGDVAAPLELCHALGGGHVLVVVKGQHDHVAHLEDALQVPGKLPKDEVVPGLRLGLHALHQADLAVHERGGGRERALLRERVRQLFLERAEPRGIDRHAFLLYRGGLPSRAARSLSSGVFFSQLEGG